MKRSGRSAKYLVGDRRLRKTRRLLQNREQWRPDPSLNLISSTRQESRRSTKSHETLLNNTKKTRAFFVLLRVDS